MKRTLKIIEQLEKNRKEPNILRESISFISSICKILKPKNTLEIGTFNGYSALWLSLYSKNVTSIEIDNENAGLAKENLRKAYCRNVNVIVGDALFILREINKKFNVILIDGAKNQYKEYLELCLKLINKNGLIFVDNTISHKDKLRDFFDFLNKNKIRFKELNLGKGLVVISN